ncbi:hypothetical protein [Aquirufa sp.]|jgi:hypothetical protein|uniref:hypothetical protein n=1 Tax=Aquirufa sp. TaxID=2676249 RepID=UPI0037BFA2C8
MKSKLLAFCLLVTLAAQGQMLNDSPFDANVAHPKYSKGKGPKVLFDKGHYNFIVDMGLAKPLMDVAAADGYRVHVDSLKFTKAYLAKYKMIVIFPAMPFKFGSKSQVTDETTFTPDELTALHDWVSEGGSLLMFDEHAPIDKSVTPLFNKFRIQLSIGIVSDSLNYETKFTIPNKETLLKFTRSNGLLNTDHPITQGEKTGEQINNIMGYSGGGLTGAGYTNLFKLSPSATIKKYSGSAPSGTANSQGLAGKFGKGKVVALGDCNGFTAMYVMIKSVKFSAGMQVADYDWKQFALNTLHWLSI